ncbi:hypothetical protein B0H34DRAFT_716235 [Crassisporium funariophilum]|nr:hypothetical protein B0H34DRAFT_716235 [Crassisporium funariophilum]
MRRATHEALRLRDAHDAHVLFEAVRQGFLRPIARRLTQMEERLLIRPGAIFVWFENKDLKSWKDGRVWERGCEQKPYVLWRTSTTKCRSVHKQRIDGGESSSSALSHQHRAANHHPKLVKQTYSAWVTVKPGTEPQKWNLTAYFTSAELLCLPTIDHDIDLRTIIVPPGIYRSANIRGRASGSGGGSKPHVEGMRYLLSTMNSNVGGPHPARPYTTLSPHGQRLMEYPPKQPCHLHICCGQEPNTDPCLCDKVSTLSL